MGRCVIPAKAGIQCLRALLLRHPREGGDPATGDSLEVLVMKFDYAGPKPA
jgi:hypothetical protein